MGIEFNEVVGKRMYNARKELKMSRSALGKIVNLHETTVKRYEDGNIKSLDIEKIKEFAAALMVPAPYLMGWDEAAWPESSTGVVDAKNELEMLISRISSSTITLFGDSEMNDSAKALLENSLAGIIKNIELIIAK